jgi:small subunit ribosomal protein S13
MKSYYFRKILNNPNDFNRIKDKLFVLYLIDFFGLNYKNVFHTFELFGLNQNIKLSSLTFNKFKQILLYIENTYLLENRLRKKILFYKRYFVKNKHIKGFRSINGLPVRGQRTHSNAKTPRNLKFRY